MKHSFQFLAIGAVFLTMFSCGNESSKTVESERDSLKTITAQQQTILDDMTSAMASISKSLDSIALQEKMIINGVDEAGVPLSKKNLKSRLETLSEIVKGQRSKLGAMEKSLGHDNPAVKELQSIISYINTSLEQKEDEIEKIKAEVDSKDFSIASLNSRVSSLNKTVASVQQENEAQREQMKQQNAQYQASINEVFYVIGTKDQLVESGVLSSSGALFSKATINFASINKSALTKADKRTLKTIKINGKSPKILSEEPKGSYTLDKDKNVLTITDAEKFWSTNNKILVIQIK
ncbi:MAG: hypothetical protein J1E57_03900 [Prevotella sp.]|nr:hypothetical protein [Prevotella sp.]